MDPQKVTSPQNKELDGTLKTEGDIGASSIPKPPQPPPENTKENLPVIRTFERDTAHQEGKPIHKVFSVSRTVKDPKDDLKELQEQFKNHDTPIDISQEATQNISDPMEHVTVDHSVIPPEELTIAETVQEGRDFSKLKSQTQESIQTELPPEELEAPIEIKEQEEIEQVEEVKAPQGEPPQPIIRTYEDDAAVALKDKGASIISVAVAEQEKNQERLARQQEERKQAQRRKIFTILSLILILGGVSVLGYIYLYPILSRQKPIEEIRAQAHIFTEHIQELNITNLSSALIKQEISAFNKKPLSEGITQLRLLHTAQDNTSSSDYESYSFFETISERVPRAMMRSFDPLFTLAFSKQKDAQISPILIMNVDSFDIAYAGMLRWEESMVSDLAFLFPVRTEQHSASTTQQIPVFYDLIVDNKDTRAIESSNGNIRIIYSFPDRQTLIITSDTNTLREVFKRLERRALSR